MLCQTCSAYNEDDREFCFRCQNKLLVLSGVTSFEEDDLEDYEEEEDLSLDEHLLELERLADTAGAQVVGSLTQQLDRPNPATYLGKGKVDELREKISAEGVTLVLFDDELEVTGAQHPLAAGSGQALEEFEASGTIAAVSRLRQASGAAVETSIGSSST